MTNWYTIFYWLTVADGTKQFLNVASNIFTAAAVLSFIAYVITAIVKAVQTDAQKLKTEDEEKTHPTIRGIEVFRKFAIRLFYPMLFLSIITWAGYVLTPTKKDCLFIIAGGAVGNFMTTDTMAKQLPSDVTKFLHMSLKNQIDGLNSDAKKELGFQSPKEKLIDKVKDLSKEQLIEYLKSDTTVVK